jgi:hypothetical protein
VWSCHYDYFEYWSSTRPDIQREARRDRQRAPAGQGITQPGGDDVIAQCRRVDSNRYSPWDDSQARVVPTQRPRSQRPISTSHVRGVRDRLRIEQAKKAAEGAKFAEQEYEKYRQASKMPQSNYHCIKKVLVLCHLGTTRP